MNAYAHIFERCADDAAFLWLLRSIAQTQPHYFVSDLAALEQRLTAQVTLLMTAPEQAWALCSGALHLGEPGEVFVAALLAFTGQDEQKIEQVIGAGLEHDQALPGLISALGWLPPNHCHNWLKRLLGSDDARHQHLALAACSVRREDPQQRLNALLNSAGCRAHPTLWARALRLIGELKRRDLEPALQVAMGADDPQIVFWACWSAVLLGDRSAAKHLQAFALQPGPCHTKALALAFRALPPAEAKNGIKTLAGNPLHTRDAIKATAALGDPQAVTWLLGQMREPGLARLAGEAFSTITGIELQQNALTLPAEALPESRDDEPEDEDLGWDEDEHLPYPDPAKVAAAWQRSQSQFVMGKRYLQGRLIGKDNLKQILTSGGQRSRLAAALELALLEPDQPLVNAKRRVI